MQEIKNIKCPKHYVSVVSMLKYHQNNIIQYLQLIEEYNTSRKSFARTRDVEGEAKILQTFRHEFMHKNIGGVKIHNGLSNKMTVILIRRQINNTQVYLKYLKNQIRIQDVLSSHKIIKLKPQENEPNN